MSSLNKFLIHILFYVVVRVLSFIVFIFCKYYPLLTFYSLIQSLCKYPTPLPIYYPLFSEFHSLTLWHCSFTAYPSLSFPVSFYFQIFFMTVYYVTLFMIVYCGTFFMTVYCVMLYILFITVNCVICISSAMLYMYNDVIFSQVSHSCPMFHSCCMSYSSYLC